MGKRFQIHRPYFQACLSFIRYLNPFENYLPPFINRKAKHVGFASIASGPFAKLLDSVNENFALNGLNGVFSSYMTSDNGTGTRAQLLLNFESQ